MVNGYRKDMETLIEIWQRLKEQGYESDKGSVHSYLPVYEKLLAPYRETAVNVLEIGVFKGDSLMMWRKYFTKAMIHGIDCSVTPHGGLGDLRVLLAQPGERLNLHIFNAEDQNEVKKRFNGIKFDVIIEDAGHEINQQLNLYNIWSKYLATDGIYIIEDVQNIDKDKYLFEMSHTVYDLRPIKSRYDDVLIVIK